MCYLLFDLVSRGSISPLFLFFFFSSPILQVMIISDLVTEFLGSEPGFDPEFSDCYLITLHQTLSVKYTQWVLGVQEMEKARSQIILQ